MKLCIALVYISDILGCNWSSVGSLFKCTDENTQQLLHNHRSMLVTRPMSAAKQQHTNFPKFWELPQDSGTTMLTYSGPTNVVTTQYLVKWATGNRICEPSQMDIGILLLQWKATVSHCYALQTRLWASIHTHIRD
jgi:hypothetical protein